MAYEPKPNTASLFRNAAHEQNPRAPHAKGSGLIEINGIAYPIELAAWSRETKTGSKYQSLVIKVKTENARRVNDADLNVLDSTRTVKRPNAEDLKRGVPIDEDAAF